MKRFEKKVCFATGETLGICLAIAERFGQELREYENILRGDLIYNYSNIQFENYLIVWLDVFLFLEL